MPMNDQDNDSNKLVTSYNIPSGPQGYLVRYWHTAKNILLKPKLFFDTMPLFGGFQEPILFLGTSCTAAALLTAIVSFGFLGIPSTILSALVGTFVGAGVAFGLSKAMGGKGSFEATFRAFAYISCVHLFYPIPALGAIAALYGLVLSYLGISKVQDLTPGKTCAIVFLTGFLSGLLLFIGQLTALWSKFFHI